MDGRLSPERLALPRIGLGGSAFGNLYRVTSDEDCAAAIDAAWDAGVRYFDTAPHYGLGLSERRLGALLAGRPRSEWILSTKVGRLLEPTPEHADRLDDGFAVPATHRRVWDFSRDGILRSLEASLERLGMDRIDVVYLHDPDDHWEQASTAAVDTLIELRDQGVVRAIGAGMNQSAMLTEFVRRCDIDVVMLAGRYTLLDRSAESDLLPLTQERGVAVVAAGVYNSGLLSRAYVDPGSRFDYRTTPDDLVRRASRLAEICRTHGVTLPDAAVQFPLRHPAIASVVIGARNRQQVEQGIERASVPIPEGLWDAFDARPSDENLSSTREFI
jgi:D-threo-aldose 1-dehydrogenase